MVGRAMTDAADSVNRFPIFSTAVEVERHPAGAVIFSEGDSGTVLYVIRSGQVALRIGGKTVETLGPDGMFGEMALVDSAIRSATAVAESECELVPVDLPRFRRLVQDTPFFAERVMRVMAERLRRETA
jgi:CRP/FNR family transcriptional regulator, cyclic AMP receptor protein